MKPQLFIPVTVILVSHVIFCSPAEKIEYYENFVGNAYQKPIIDTNQLTNLRQYFKVYKKNDQIIKSDVFRSGKLIRRTELNEKGNPVRVESFKPDTEELNRYFTYQYSNLDESISKREIQYLGNNATASITDFATINGHENKIKLTTFIPDGSKMRDITNFKWDASNFLTYKEVVGIDGKIKNKDFFISGSNRREREESFDPDGNLAYVTTYTYNEVGTLLTKQRKDTRYKVIVYDYFFSEKENAIIEKYFFIDGKKKSESKKDLKTNSYLYQKFWDDKGKLTTK